MSLYLAKENWFNSSSLAQSYNIKKSSASEFYRDLFPVGTFEKELGKLEEYPKTNKGNGFIVYTVSEERKHTRMVFDDLQAIFELQNNECAFMSPIAYFGKNRTSANARMLYALTFDLDEVGDKELDIFWGYHIFQNHYPRPTYVVNSGGGVHLYYVLKKPLPMTPFNQKNLKRIKYALTKRIWNKDNSKCLEPQYQGLNQGFRLVGSKTKNGEEVTVYRTGERLNVEDFLDYLSESEKVEFKIFEPKISLEEAKEKYPEWYHQRIELGRKKKNWVCNRALYDWWKTKVEFAKYHHRYFYIMALTIYAIKCNVPFDELRADAYSFQDYLNHKEPGNPFTNHDIESALEMYQECYISFPRDEIEHITAIDIPKNRRNGRTQQQHIQIMNFFRDVVHQLDHWRNEDGRPPLDCVVYDYLKNNPGAKKCDVIRGTGLSRPTVYKYYDECLKTITTQHNEQK
ncbi:MAG: hypothetical protein UH963_09555 [Agathobacter sp.]|nr:hypothetical protein [Agathobacter sp.]